MLDYLGLDVKDYKRKMIRHIKITSYIQGGVWSLLETKAVRRKRYYIPLDYVLRYIYVHS